MFAFGILVSTLLAPVPHDAEVMTNPAFREYTVVRFENGPVVASRGVQPFVSSGFKPIYSSPRPAAQLLPRPAVKIRAQPKLRTIAPLRNPQAPPRSPRIPSPESPATKPAASNAQSAGEARRERRPTIRPPMKSGKGRDI